ncbi:MAG: hypothetical protein KDG50_10850 [Chromatiales bacterium]|nr:hypothetical protein [Chromatiales bacterium]
MRNQLSIGVLAAGPVAALVLVAGVIASSASAVAVRSPDRHANDASAVRALAAHRARARDLTQKARVLEQLTLRSADQGSVPARSHEMLFDLIEIFAQDRWPDPDERVAILNRLYERELELVELRVKGFDHRADYLERRSRLLLDRPAL